MKKTIISILLGILAVLGVGGGGYAIFGGTGLANTNYQVVAGTVPTSGTPSTLCLMPTEYVYSNSTTTNSADNGCEITQLLDVGGLEKLNFSLTGKSVDAEHLLYVMFQGSLDGVNWYDLSGAATTTDFNGTSTLVLSTNKVAAINLGTTTTTKQFELEIPAYKFLRTLYYSTSTASAIKANIIVSWLNK